MGFKKWVVSNVDKQAVRQLAEECDADPFIALIAYGRGYTDACLMDEYLSEDSMLSDPFEMADMAAAAERIKTALAESEKIAIYGDYDCDGVTATALLYDFLLHQGADVQYYIPNRHSEGYGLSVTSVEELANRGIKLIITVDNGINSVEEITFAKRQGVDVIVTDHHIPSGELPEAVAVVDPHREDCPSSFKDLSGVGVAFKLICAIGGYAPEEMLEHYADLVAIGSVADIMPLKGENRSIVRAGLQCINTSPRTGIQALLEAAGMSGKKVTAGTIGFVIAPRINAAGRMEHAEKAVELLLETNRPTALDLAAKLDEQNKERQECELKIAEQAFQSVIKNNYLYDRVIVVAGEGWHDGVIGIAAAKLVERFERPVILISTQNGVAKGSGRSLGSFSLFNAVHSAAECLTKYGGHKAAAGLSMDAARIDEFREKINRYAATVERPVPELHLDCKINPSALSLDMAYALSDLEPFGVGNPTPLFGMYGMRLDRITPIGSGKHLRFLFSRGTAVVAAIQFGVTAEQFLFSPGDTVDIAATIEAGIYNNKDQLNVFVKGIRLSDTNDTLALEQIELYEKFKRNELKDEEAVLIAPDRDDIAAVFRIVSKGVASPHKIKHALPDMLAAKIEVALDVLCELGILCESSLGADRTVKVCPGVKTSLDNSKILKSLSAAATSV